jgi:hypothetical protein
MSTGSVFMIQCTISRAEHAEDREQYIEMIVNGWREVFDEEGYELTLEQVGNLTRAQLVEYGEGEMDEGWDALWSYPNGSSGIDKDEAVKFFTREEAESHVIQHHTPTTDEIEIMEMSA